MTPRLCAPPRRFTSAVVASAVVAAMLTLAAPTSATAAPDQSGTPITPSQYTVVDFDSQSPAYPAPPSLDGTALGAVDGDYSSEWTTAFSNGASTPGAHWLTVDVGGSFTLTGIDYSVKKQANGPIKDFKVFVTDDPAVAKNAAGAWGSPVATGTFAQPTSDTQVQTILFSNPVKGRYVKVESDSTYNAGNIAAISELRVRATGDTTPAPVTPPPPTAVEPSAPISNGKGLTVQVGKDFPQVVGYGLNGKKLAGQADQLTAFTVNGTDHKATTSAEIASDHATYTSTFADLPGLTITSTITATEKNTVEFAITKIEGPAASTVNMLAIPHHSLVSVDSGDAHSSLARTQISTNSTTTADRFIAITGTAPADVKPVGTPYGFVTNSQLSAGIITNATDDSAQDSNTNWNTRLMSQIVDAGGGAKRAQLSVGNWTYAPKGATDPRVATFELPRATVVLAEDLNTDGAMTWQDGAIAYRAAMEHPNGADRVPDRVVQHIPFNFASQATNPFLKTLDNVKRIAMTTDGLGQWVLEKGYANEGHDSGHPDYGGDYNTRAGGLADLNTLASQGANYNADLAVHVNVTEAYPQAKDFSEGMISGQVNGWDWLNQSYHIDQRKDLGTGAILDRFKQLREQAPGIKTVYIDAYYSSGWLADELAAKLHEMGFEVASEWAYKFEGSSIWSHWANDKNYGGATNKGINSNIVRFIANSDRDVWNTDPLLGGEQLSEFEGWTGHDDWNAFYSNIWTSNLPTKFLQHFQLMSWNPGTSAALTGNVSVAMVNGQRQITMDGAPVLNGGTYLLPWGSDTTNADTGSPAKADKMYFYSKDGGTTTFTLTPQFQGASGFGLYKLTDQGRVKIADVEADGGRVTLTGDAATPYVLVPSGSTVAAPSAPYGEGSGVVDPGFNAGNLDAWGPTGGAHLTRTDKGDNQVTLGTDASGIAQEIKDLTPGATYSLMADVGIAEGRRRAVTMRVSGQSVKVSNSFDITPAKNMLAADASAGSYAQRTMVTFTAGKNGQANFAITADAGSAAVTIDNVRLIKVDTVSVATPVTGPSTDPSQPTGNQIVSENFESNEPGWGPFVKGDAGGTNDPRTSISGLHDPYSQKGWKNTYKPYNAGTLKGQAVDDVIDGNHSLKSHEENTGLVYRTVPATAKFVTGHSYKVDFTYQTNLANQWQWVVGADTVDDGKVTSRDLIKDTFAPALSTAAYSRTFTTGCGDDWVGLRKIGGANGTDFVMDNLTITDLGQAPASAACAAVSGPSALNASPATANTVKLSFTNAETTDATNVALSVDGLPAGWTAQMTTQGGNLFPTVKAGETVTSTWLITPPASAAGTSASLTLTGTYFNACTTKSVTGQLGVQVSDRAMVPLGSMTATADSAESSAGPGEGPASNVLDGDPSTIWHTAWSGVPGYPHWLQLAMDGTYTVDGFGYQERQSGGQNGKIKDYQVFVSQDGASWTKVAGGAFTDTLGMQTVSFAPVATKFVKFEADSSINGLPYAAAAEMRVFGSSPTQPTGFDPATRPADTACTK